MSEENYWSAQDEDTTEFEEAEEHESLVEEEVVETTTDDTVELEVVYSKLKYQGKVYEVGEVLELTQEEADDLLETLSGRPHRHLEFV